MENKEISIQMGKMTSILHNKIFIIVFFIIFLSSHLFSFGKNKVQYEKFNWDIIKTAHFNIYYNKGQKLLAKETSLILEDAAADLSAKFRFELTRVLPVIIYNSHNDFEQSNVILQMIGEGTGGFTEFFKSRIVVPFTGSYGDYRHVLHHELVHGFQFNLLLGNFWESLFTRQFMHMPPLWFIEGNAEYFSIGWESEVELFLRDATVHDMLVPIERLEDLWSLRGYEYFMVYKQGQGFLHYITTKYGKYKVGDILKVFARTRDFHHSFKVVIGKSHYDVFKDWVKHLRKKYWPLVKSKKYPEDFSKKLTKHLSDGSVYNVKPVWSSDGKKIAFLTDRHIYMSLVIVDADTGEELDVLAESGTTSDFEEMHSKDNVLSWSGDGRYLVFISKAGRYDKINIYDNKEEEFIDSINPELDALASPDISPDNKKIVFSGVKNGKNDLYVIDINGNNLKRLTKDKYFDTYPTWNLTAEYIIFTSNRDKGYLSRDNDIFLLNLKKNEITKIVSSKGINNAPRLDKKNNKLVFVSDRDGFSDLYIKKVNGFSNINSIIKNKEYKITDVITAVSDPCFSPDGKKIVFSSFNKLGQDVCVMDVPEELEDKIASVVKETQKVNNEEITKTAFDVEESEKEEYKFNLTPDWIMGGFIYSSVAGFGGFTYLGFSDILGNHRFSIATDFLGGNNDFNFEFIYYYLAHRINYGIGIFHYKDYYYFYTKDEFGYEIDKFYKRRYGVDLKISYPFTKFLRSDVDLLVMKYIRHSENEEEVESWDTNLYISGFSFVYDTILWGITGPVMGFRGRISFEKSYRITGADWLYELAFIDLRKYFLMSRKYTFALRYQFGSVWGRDRNKNKFYIGGFNTLRGHRYSEYSGTRMFLFNMEYRYPFVNVIQIGWPVTFNIQNLRAVFFWDFGSAWDNTEKWQIGRKGGVYRFKDLKSGLGWGLRFGIYVLRFRLDFATPWNGSTILPLSKWQGLFSIGYDF